MPYQKNFVSVAKLKFRRFCYDYVFEVLNLTGCDKIFSINVAKYDVSTYPEMSFKNFLTSKANHSADKIFIVDENTSYTWAEIEICATIIAEDLSRFGVTSGSRVGICSINSANRILTFFAIQKLEAIAVLINFNLQISEIVTTSKIGDVDFLCYGDLPEMTD